MPTPKLNECEAPNRAPRAKHLLAGDTEQTAVRFDITTKSDGVLSISATVDHVGGDIVEGHDAVHLPPYFRSYAQAVGFDASDVRFEWFLVGLAMAAFYKVSR